MKKQVKQSLTYGIREKYQQGLATTIDLSDAENSLTVAELQLQQSYINWLKDKANMRYLTGTIY